MKSEYPVQSRALEVSQRALAELNQIGSRMVEMARAGEEAGPIQEYVQSKRRQFSVKLRTEELARIEGMLEQWNKTLGAATALARTAAGHQVAAEAIQLEVETGLARLRSEYQKQQAELQASSEQARLQAGKTLAELRTANREAEQREQAVEKLSQLREQLERERLELELAKVRAERGRLPHQALDTPEQATEALRRMVAAQMCTLAQAHARADQIIEEMRERGSQPPEQLEEERQYLHEMVRRLFRKAEG